MAFTSRSTFPDEKSGAPLSGDEHIIKAVGRFRPSFIVASENLWMFT
jgi:hypothetical protein